MVVRHGERIIVQNAKDDSGNEFNLSVAQFISYNLAHDDLTLSNPLYNRILNEANEKSSEPDFKAEPWFLHHNDIEISRIATALAAEEYHITPQRDNAPQNEEAALQREQNETEALYVQVKHLLNDFRMEYIEKHLKELQVQISQAASDMNKLSELMTEYRNWQDLRNKLARLLGSNIIV